MQPRVAGIESEEAFQCAAILALRHSASADVKGSASSCWTSVSKWSSDSIRTRAVTENPK